MTILHFGPSLLISLVGVLYLVADPVRLGASDTAVPRAEAFLFSFFRDNGQDGLFLAGSPDGLKWTELKPPGRSFLQSKLGDKLMRDPCLRQAPDGTFHLVWTTGWGDRIIGYASSKDLVDWTGPKAIPVMMHEPTARNAWAPELFFDDARNQWLIFWSTTIPGRFVASEGAGDDKWNHRIYHVTTRDFQTFSDSRLLYDGGFNVIDATLLKFAGRFHLVVKDETLKPVKKHLRFAVADRPEGPFGSASEPFTIGWVEGPSAIQVGAEVYVYFDHYAQPQYYGAVKTKDFKTWEDVSKQLSLPPGARHGTVLRVPETVIARLR